MTLRYPLQEFDVGDELSKLVDPLDDEIKDERREERLLRMSMRTKAMPLSTYTRFSEARTVSFCGGSKGKKYCRDSNSLMHL